MAWAARHAKGSKAWAITEAKKTGKKVVAHAETTATTRTTANPDGTLTTELTSGPERVWQDGRWHKVDVTLTAADGDVRAKRHPNGLRLAGRGGTVAKSLSAARNAPARDLVTLGSGDQAVTLQWKGGLPEPELDGTTARYKNAVPGADVIVEATRTGFEQFVEIERKPTAGDYSYTLPVKAEGLKARANKDGSVTFTDTGTGEARATMPAPVMWDASVDERSGEHTRRARVDMEVVERGKGRIDLVVTPDAGFLADPATKYPVTVDPSTSALSNTFDTYVQRGESVDWSTDTELDLGNPGTTNPDGTYRTARSFITWNTTPIQDALIIDTNLALWNFHSGNTDCSTQSWTVWDTGAPSTSSRWTSQPAWNQQYHSSTQTRGNPGCTGSQPDGWINADVDTLVQSWASAKATRGHMGLRAATDDVRAWKRVNSADNAANQPRLTVTYNYRPSDGTDRQAGGPFKSYAGVWAVNTTTPTLRDTFTDPDGDTVTGTFQVYDAATDTPITTPAGEGLLVSGYGEQGEPVSVTVPAGQLQDGKTYKFRTNAYDGTHYNLSWSSWTHFVVDTTAPDAPASVTSATYPENWGGGSAGTPGVFDVTTGADDAYEVRYRLDPYEDDAPDHGWSAVRTTTGALKTMAVDASYTVTPAADGNHLVQTRTVDRAGNAGPIKDYGFVAGNRDYNREQKIDIKLPQPDLGAAYPEQTDPPQPAPGWKGGVAPRTIDRGDGSKVIITPKAEQSLAGTRKAARALRTLAPEYPDPIVTAPWCQPDLYGDAQKSLMTRNEACVFLDLTFIWESKPITGVETISYSASFEVAYQVKTHPKSGDLKTWIQLNPVRNTFPAQDRSVLFGAGDPEARLDSMMCLDFDPDTKECDDGVELKNYDFYGTLAWKGGMNGGEPNDTHMATGTADHKWDGEVRNASGGRDVDLSMNLPVYFAGATQTDVEPPPAPDGRKREWVDGADRPWRIPTQVDVRCDKVAANGLPGCVMPKYYPEYKIHTARFPAAAAHVWMIQNKSKPSKGLGASVDRPLHYLSTKARTSSGWDRDDNRERVMCPKYTGKRADGWVPKKRFVKHSWTAPHPELGPGGPTPPVDSISCDEFPFSATYESPGVPSANGGRMPAGVNGGGECIQTVAARTDDGSEHLLDDTRYDPPTWDETCGRSSMSGYVNTGSMQPFSNTFTGRFRMLDGDAYTVDPGRAWFENCDPATAELVCEMTKP
ncbi:DNRLRE domain-containing protein [Streptomyces pini]|nr:DNRLRE domain-containing protein [Streptomyces pini]